MYSLLTGWSVEARWLEREIQERAATPVAAPRAMAEAGDDGRPGFEARGPDPGLMDRAEAAVRLPAFPRTISGRRRGALVLVVAIAALLVAFSWDRWGRPVEGGALPATGSPAGSLAASTIVPVPTGAGISVLAPDEGAFVLASSVDVRGVAGSAVRRVHAVLTRGAAVLGTGELEIRQAGPFRMAIAVPAEHGPGRARLTVYVDTDRGRILLAARMLRLCAACV